MKKIFTLLTALLCTIAQVSWAECVILDDPNEYQIENNWSSGSPQTITIDNPKPAGKLTFNFRRTGLTPSNGVTVTAYFNDGSNSTIINDDKSGTQTFENFGDKIVTSLKFSPKGMYGKYVSNIKLTQAAYAKNFSASSITFDTKTIYSPTGEKSLTFDWSDTNPFTCSLSGDDTQFAVSISKNAETCSYGTAKVTVTYAR